MDLLDYKISNSIVKGKNVVALKQELVLKENIANEEYDNKVTRTNFPFVLANA